MAHDDSQGWLELQAQARAGSTAAQNALVAMARPWIRSRAESLLNERLLTVVEVEDIVQDSSFQIFKNIPGLSFANRSAFKNYVHSTVRNIVIDLVRRHFQTVKRSARTSSLDESAGGEYPDDRQTLVETLINSATSPSMNAAKREARIIVEMAMQRLTDDHRRVIQYSIFEHRSRASIAKEMSRSEEAVRAMLARAVQALAVSLQNLGYVEGSSQ
jgi:RNA polymerase sigma factor (sigma-70 family)